MPILSALQYGKAVRKVGMGYVCLTTEDHGKAQLHEAVEDPEGPLRHAGDPQVRQKLTNLFQRTLMYSLRLFQAYKDKPRPIFNS